MLNVIDLLNSTLGEMVLSGRARLEEFVVIIGKTCASYIRGPWIKRYDFGIKFTDEI